MSDSHVFSLKGNRKQTPIEVEISRKPSCSVNVVPCKYMAGGKQICSHVVWVLLKQLGVPEDDNRLHQITYTNSEVKAMLTLSLNKGNSVVQSYTHKTSVGLALEGYYRY